LSRIQRMRQLAEQTLRGATDSRRASSTLSDLSSRLHGLIAQLC